MRASERARHVCGAKAGPYPDLRSGLRSSRQRQYREQIVPARLSEVADFAGMCHPERNFWPLRARGSRSFPARSSGTA